MFASALLSGAVAGGCASSEMMLSVRPNDALNDQRPVYLLVRNVDEKTYLEETYEAAAAKVMAPDDSVLKMAVVFPGTPQDIKVSPPAKGQVGVYVFFYRAEGDWKALLPSTAELFEVEIKGSRLKIEQK